MRAAIYARVSTDEQSETGYGLSHQINQCEEYAAKRGHTLVIPPITDDYTGSTAIRPGIAQLTDAIAAHNIEVILIHRTDRLGRTLTVQGILENEFKYRGVRVEYVSMQFEDTPQGRFARQVIGAVDEFDYNQLVKKLKDHKAEAVKCGSIILTRPPYGYKVVKEKIGERKTRTKLEISEEEAKVVRWVFEWYVYGDGDGQPLSALAICKRLTTMRLPTRGDEVKNSRVTTPPGTWTEIVIHRILANETYVGRWYYRKTKMVPVLGRDKNKQVPAPREDWLCVAVPCLVSEELFQAARDRAAYNEANARRNRRREYLFSGMLKCDNCKSSFCGNINSYHGRSYYRCVRTNLKPLKFCNMPTYNEAELDAVIWPWIKDVVQNPEKIEQAITQHQQEADDQNSRTRNLIAATERLLVEKQREQNNLIAAFARNPIPALEENIVRMQQEIDGYKADRENYIAKLVKTHYTPEYIADVKAACARIAIGFERFAFEEKRETYQLLDLRVRLAVEEGYKVAYAECEIYVGEKRLVVARFIGNRLP